MKKEKNWREDPEQEFECQKCGKTWKLKKSVTCPKCDGINKMEDRKVVKIQHYIYCPNCDYEVKGNSESQVRYNLKKHMEKCKKK